MLGIPPWVDQQRTKVRLGIGYGQATAGRHLSNHNVSAGAIFLFFGGFKSIHKRTGIRGQYLFGWMRVKKVIRNYGDLLNHLDDYNLHNHPHASRDAFNNPDNMILIPDQYLFEDSNIPGYGYFLKLNDSLLLSENITNIHVELKPGKVKNLSLHYPQTQRDGCGAYLTQIEIICSLQTHKKSYIAVRYAVISCGRPKNLIVDGIRM